MARAYSSTAACIKVGAIPTGASRRGDGHGKNYLPLYTDAGHILGSASIALDLLSVENSDNRSSAR